MQFQKLGWGVGKSKRWHLSLARNDLIRVHLLRIYWLVCVCTISAANICQIIHSFAGSPLHPFVSIVYMDGTYSSSLKETSLYRLRVRARLISKVNHLIKCPAYQAGNYNKSTWPLEHHSDFFESSFPQEGSLRLTILLPWILRSSNRQKVWCPTWLPSNYDLFMGVWPLGECECLYLESMGQ